MEIAWGLHKAEIEVPAEKLVPLRQGERYAPLADVAAAAEDALERPVDFPPLRRALTPDDRVAIVVEPGVPRVSEILAATLRHLVQARVQPAAVTIVCLQEGQDQSWIDTLPEEFEDVQIETHHPGERKLLSYLATTKSGRRIYLNRTLVDADQAVILTHRRYDTHLGYGGGAGVIWPGLCETDTAEEVRTQINLASPIGREWKLKHEADEIAWHLGSPFFVQVIVGENGEPVRIVGGVHESLHRGEQMLDESMHAVAGEPSDLVIAAVAGDPAGQTFETLARAALNASHVLTLGGNIVLLTDAEPEFGPSMQVVRSEEEPRNARQRIMNDKPSDYAAGYIWASVAAKAKLYLLSRLPLDTAEEIYATPLDRVGQVQKLIAAASRVIVLAAADRTAATVESPA